MNSIIYITFFLIIFFLVFGIVKNLSDSEKNIFEEEENFIIFCFLYCIFLITFIYFAYRFGVNLSLKTLGFTFLISVCIGAVITGTLKTDNLKIRKEKINFDEYKYSRLSKNLILVIEDDLEMRKLISAHLEYSGFDILKADDGIEGKALALKYSPDLILLELMLPKVDGLTLCRQLRRDERTSNIPILMITALGGLKDKVTGYKSGADDYILKPFDLEHLIVRIQGLLRRNNRLKFNYFNQQKVLNYGPLKLDPEKFDIIWFENRISLSALEYVLLSFLLQSHDQIVSKESILNEMKYWDKNKIYWRDKNINRIKILIMNLRTKLEPDPLKPKYIKTIYGKGYCLLLD